VFSVISCGFCFLTHGLFPLLPFLQLIAQDLLKMRLDALDVALGVNDNAELHDSYDSASESADLTTDDLVS
jgi:hypothetical protein